MPDDRQLTEAEERHLAEATERIVSPLAEADERVIETALRPKRLAGQPGNVYGWNGRYAGQVEQQYNTCDGTVWAHYAWDSGYAATYGGDTITLTVSSPEGDYSLPLQFSANQGHDQTVGGRNIHNVSPDDWRAGASWNNNGCVAWGTLHWYGGADWSGPKATCGSWIAPR